MLSSYDKANPLMMSAQILLGAEQAANDLGIELLPSLEASDISIAQLQSPDQMLPLHKVVTFLNDLAERSDCEYSGLLIAKYQPPLRFAMIGQLVRFADNLGMAIQDAVKFSLLNSEFSRWELEAHEDAVSLIRHTRANLDAPMFQLRTVAIAVVYKSINAICQRRIPLKQVTFALSPPRRRDRFEQFFGAPVIFNHVDSGLVLPRAYLDTPIPTADPQVRALLLQHLSRLSAEQYSGLNIISRVRHYVEKTIGSSQCNLEAMCASWDVNPRALQRALREHNSNFRRILLDVRQELAEQYLLNSSISLAELSDILGYTNASAFSRAFKAQAGVAPDFWRAAHQ